jgi:hypothetical protein
MRCRDTVAIEPKRIRSAGAAFHQFFRRSQPSVGAGTRLTLPRYEARHVRVIDAARQVAPRFVTTAVHGRRKRLA